MKQEMGLMQMQKMSQRMIQSLQILQMNSQELETFLKEKELENPLFELERDFQEEEQKSELQKKLEWIVGADEQNRIYYKEEQREYGQRASAEGGVMEEGLPAYVLSQLIPCFKTQKQKKIYEFLAYNLDEKGYLQDMPQCLMEAFSLSKEQAEAYLLELKKCDPAGVGAENLQECLLLQLERMGNACEIEKKIVKEYLKELGKNQLPQISKAMGISLEQTIAACKKIQNLNPKPSQGFSARSHLKYLLPDVTVVKFDGYFEILLDENTQFSGRLNSYYLDMMKQENNSEVQTYLEEKYRQAVWIFQCIATRKETLLKICRGIVEHQREFFAQGPGHLKPLVMSHLALELGVHESTVSRTVRDKHLQCSWGIYPLHYFFARGLSENGQDYAPEEIKKYLSELVGEEDKKSPLSDQKLCEKLQEMGVSISRRTIAKYRNEMGIKDARGRRVY